MLVRGSRASVSGIGGTSGPLVTHPAAGATDSIVGMGGIQTCPPAEPGAFARRGFSLCLAVLLDPGGEGATTIAA
jgi:hypothetical protein